MAKAGKRSRSKHRPKLAITDLIDRATLQALQDRFSEKHKCPTAILDENADPITFERRLTPYCQEIRGTSAGYDACRKSDRKVIKQALETGRAAWGICKRGNLLDFAVPLKVAGSIRAFFFIGQIRGQRGKKRASADGLSQSLRQLHARVAKAGDDDQVRDASLKRKYRQIPQRTTAEIDDLEQVGIEFAEDLSRALTKLEKWRRPQAVSEFVAKIAQAPDFDSLLDTCVGEIPKLLGTKNCSILTVIRGKREDAPKLVLQRTSYRPNKHREGMATYDYGQGLTGWVWRNDRPLRLDNIRDKSEISKYRKLRWSKTTDDSDYHREWMGVPIHGQSGDVIGVIRVPQKSRTERTHGGGFTFEDEILLMSIGQRVAQQIEAIHARKRVETALPACLNCAIELAQAVDAAAVGRVVLRACERAWGRAGRAHFFNQLENDGRTLKIAGVRGALGDKESQGATLPLDESLSGVSLLRRRAVIVHDLNKAREKRSYFPVVEGLQCGMSAPISFRDKDFGALSVGADRQYEFAEEPDLHILCDLASLAGAALARLEAEEESKSAFAEYSRRAGHALLSRITTLEATSAALRATIRGKSVVALDTLDDAVEFLKSAAAQALRFGHAWEPAEFSRFDIAPLIERVTRLQQDRRLSWQVRGAVDMYGDSHLIEQMILELVVNARRAAPRGNGKIAVKAFQRKRGKQKGYETVIAVKDNGPGVPQDQKLSIFRPYNTSQDSRLGLGLSIVKRIAEAHAGSAEERGRAGQGAYFRVTIPQHKGEQDG